MRIAFGTVLVSLVGLVGLIGLAGCKKSAPPTEIVGSYNRSGGLPSDLRAELSIGHAGMVLTVVRMSASADLGSFGTLFAGKNTVTSTGGATIGASADLGRTVSSVRTFRSVACDASSCRFELAAEAGQEACEGSFEKVQNTLIVVAGGACQAYSGRWVVLEGLAPDPAPVGSSPAPVPVPAPFSSGSTKLEFPPDIPAPHDPMSCLRACSILDTRCFRLSGNDQGSFLACVEKEQICQARCEQVFPFFGER